MFSRYWSLYFIGGAILLYVLYQVYVNLFRNPKFYFDWIGSGYGGNDLNYSGFHIIENSLDVKSKKAIENNVKQGDKLGVFDMQGNRVSTGIAYEKQPSAEGVEGGYPNIITLNINPPEKSVLDTSEPGKKNGYLQKVGFESFRKK
jgi:hypothetical protein